VQRRHFFGSAVSGVYVRPQTTETGRIAMDIAWASHAPAGTSKIDVGRRLRCLGSRGAVASARQQLWRAEFATPIMITSVDALSLPMGRRALSEILHAPGVAAGFMRLSHGFYGPCEWMMFRTLPETSNENQ